MLKEFKKLNNEISLICLGGFHVDTIVIARSAILHNESVPVSSMPSYGGVAYNIWHNLTQLEVPCRLISILGNDAAGEECIAHCDAIVTRNKSASTFELEKSETESSARYTALFDNHNRFFLGLANMDIYEAHTEYFVQKASAAFASGNPVLCDTNLSANFFERIVSQLGDSLLVCVGTSPEKVKRIRTLRESEGLLVLLNKTEAQTLIHDITGESIANEDESDVKTICYKLRSLGFRHVCVTDKGRATCFLGNDSCNYLNSKQITGIYKNCEEIVYKKQHINNFKNHGVGDAFAAGFIASLCRKYTTDDGLRVASICAWLTAQKQASVSQSVQWGLLEQIRNAK